VTPDVVDLDRVTAAHRLLPGIEGNPAVSRLTDLAARLLRAPLAQVSLLTDVQVVAAGTGLPAGSVGASGPLADSLCTVTAAQNRPLVVTDAPADLRVAHLPPVTDGSLGSYLGVPLARDDGTVVGALCVFDPEPRTWEPQHIELLEELARSVVAELELTALTEEYRTSRLRWDVAIEAADIGGFDWDLPSDRVDWDTRMQRLFGYGPGEFVPHISEAFRRISPEDRPSLDAAIASAVESCGDYRAEFRVQLPDGRVRWIAARGRAVAGPDGTAERLLGAAYDTTEVRQARDEAVQLLDTMATGFLSVDRSWTVTYLNREGEEFAGYTAAELVGRNFWDAFPGLYDLEFGRQYRLAVEAHQRVEFEAYYPSLSRWYEVRAVPTPRGLELYFLDVTARRTDRERAEQAAVRLELLSTVSAEMAATLDAEQAVGRLADLVVPALGDWALVTLLEEGKGLRDIGWQHADPQLRPLLERYSAVRLTSLSDRSLLWRALETGEHALIPTDATAEISAVLAPGEAREMLARLAPESAAFLPLRGRGRTVGVLSLFGGEGRPALDGADLVTARDVADRAGLALDNALLYAGQRSLAEGLQRSLLTDPPEPAHCEIAVRYVPAAEIASVGGDWFDSFESADGSTTLVIGDVVGHDTAAAAAMGQVRGLLRGIAWHSGAGPAGVLSGLDAAIEGLLVATTATAVVARLDPGPRDGGPGTRLRWSNAGHPPPLALLPDGTVRVLAGEEADLLLGIDPTTPRVESDVELPPGATVLLYTDGLVERRGQDLEDGISLLRTTLAGLTGLTLDELCNALLSRLLPDEAEDDVALLAVRLHP
jgi:PAS domain S-box-containing protein